MQRAAQHLNNLETVKGGRGTLDADPVIIDSSCRERAQLSPQVRIRRSTALGQVIRGCRDVKDVSLRKGCKLGLASEIQLADRFFFLCRMFSFVCFVLF